jgi:hypothetical protein
MQHCCGFAADAPKQIFHSLDLHDCLLPHALPVDICTKRKSRRRSRVGRATERYSLQNQWAGKLVTHAKQVTGRHYGCQLLLLDKCMRPLSLVSFDRAC